MEWFWPFGEDLCGFVVSIYRLILGKVRRLGYSKTAGAILREMSIPLINAQPGYLKEKF